MKSLYITAAEPRSGKSSVAIGLMNLLRERVDNIAYIKPIGYGANGQTDPDVHLVQKLFNLEAPLEYVNPLKIDQAQEMLANGGSDELLTRILRAHKEVSKDADMVIVEGTDYQGMLSALEFDINADISNTLDAPVLIVTSGFNKSTEDIIEQLKVTKESFDEKGCTVIGVVVTRVNRASFNRVEATLMEALPRYGLPLMGVIPFNEILARFRMGEIAQKLNARVMFGAEYLNNLVTRPRIAAMTIGNALTRFTDGAILITPGDREDMLIAAMVSRVSTTYPNLSGVLLTGGFEPADSVKRLIGGLSGFNIPILHVECDTYDAAEQLSKLTVSLYPDDKQKIAQIYNDVKTHIKEDVLDNFLDTQLPRKTTPLVFLNGILEKAKSNRQRIVLPEGDEERTLKAASRVLADGVADLILLGDPQVIRAAANRCDAKIEAARIINPTASENLDRYAQEYFELRKSKGITLDQARDTMTDPIFFGTMMVHLGDADGLVSGAVHTTRHTITPSFQIIKCKPGIKQVSSIFFMCLPDRVLVYGDCAVIPNPTVEDLADIAILSAGNSKAFGFEPYVAMLSYSTGVSGVGPEVERVKEATDLVRTRCPELKVEGPIQYDAAISPETAKTKLPGSDVAGRANVFIFPDLNAGNTAYKAVQRSAKAIAIGPVLQGLGKPVNDLSRGALVEDIVYTIAITSIQAQMK